MYLRRAREHDTKRQRLANLVMVSTLEHGLAFRSNEACHTGEQRQFQFKNSQPLGHED